MGLAWDLKMLRRERARAAAGQVQRWTPARPIPVGPPPPFDFWGAEGRILAAEPCTAQPFATQPTLGSLRIAQGCHYDPGNAAYRFNTAINEYTKHASALIRFGHTNPFCDFRTIDGGDIKGVGDAAPAAKSAVYHADVIHAHADYFLQLKCGFKWRARPDQLVIRHYHGTRKDAHEKQQWPLLNMLEDDLANVVLVGARLTLCELRPSRMQWLPIPIPVDRYRALVPPTRRPGPFRIAHSPTRTDFKGTAEFISACDRLTKRGVAVEPVLIGAKRKGRKLEPDRKLHGEALRLKAECDAVFDSFWLGIQGSGLEGAAMGLPVIAGDPDVAELYRQKIGYCPYIFANDGKTLETMIEMLVTREQFRRESAATAFSYVSTYHDYPAVAKRYEQIIAKATGWPNVETKKEAVSGTP